MSRSSPRTARRIPTRLFPAATLLVVAAFACAIAAAEARNKPTDLRRERGWLPYGFRTVVTMAPGLVRERGWITHQIYANADGDSLEDLFRANNHGICGTPWTAAGAGRDWQSNLPVVFARKGPCASIDGVWDLDGDGRAEVVSTTGTPDGFRWRLNVMDALTGEPQWSIDLPAGRDENGDGNWDGNFRAFGPFTAHLPDGPRAALLVGSEAGYDERPRGVLALDARDGRELWRHPTAVKPIAADIHLVDLDGDGRQEICLLGAGVSNLDPGDEVDGRLDDHAMLLVLNDDGTLRWQRTLGEAPASGWVEPVDVDGDGRAELVVTAFQAESGRESLFVLAGDGALLASAPLPAACHSLTLVERAAGATAWLTFDGAARRYEITRAAISEGAGAELDGSSQVALVANLVGDARLELLLGGTGGQGWLVDEDLQPLAQLRDADFRFLKGGVEVRRVPGGERRLIVLGDPAHESAEFVFEVVERPVPWVLIVAGVVGVGAAGAAWRERRRRLTPEAVRALRLQLLERLVGERHGEVGPLSAAKRLAERLLGSFAGKSGDRAPLEQLIRELLREMLEVGLPQLAAAVDVAALAGLEEKALEPARQALTELRRMLTEIATAWDDATPEDQEVTASAAALKPKVENARAAFDRLRKLVERDFTASPTAILARSLAAHAERIAQLGVEVSLPGDPVPECFADAEDLAFVLDNLIENALRAMESARRRRLEVDWSLVTDSVALRVKDSGVGMTESQAKAALEPGEGKRAGGGRGLPGSIQRLRRYEGKLIVAASSPGEGTTMVLYLRYFKDGAAPAAPKGDA